MNSFLTLQVINSSQILLKNVVFLNNIFICHSCSQTLKFQLICYLLYVR